MITGDMRTEAARLVDDINNGVSLDKHRVWALLSAVLAASRAPVAVGMEAGMAIPITWPKVLTDAEIDSMMLRAGLVDCLADPYDKHKVGDFYSSIPDDIRRIVRLAEAYYGISPITPSPGAGGSVGAEPLEDIHGSLTAPSVPLGGGEVDPALRHTGPWRVGLFWSSSSPTVKVRCLAEGADQIAEYEKRADFIEWVALQAQDAAPVEPTDEDLWELRRQSKADPRCADQHWFILFARAAIAASKPVPWMTGGVAAEGKFRGLIEDYVMYRQNRVNGPEPELDRVKRDLDKAIRALFTAPPAGVQGDAARDVLAERAHQRKRWGDDHDDGHGHNTLASQAAHFLLTGQSPIKGTCWAYKSKVEDHDPRRVQMVKGAALALAAIEAFDRSAIAQGAV